MKKFVKNCCYSVLLSGMLLFFGTTVQAAEADTIKSGVYADEIDLSGKTGMEAEAVISAYVESLKDVEITLIAANDKEVKVTAGDLQISWANPEIVTEALNLGTKGNVIERYKAIKDLEQEGRVLDIQFSFDVQAINDVLTGKCVKYDQKPINYSLKRENGQFYVVPGQIGYTMDVEASIDEVYQYLTEEWEGQPCQIALKIVTAEPKGSAEELASVKDVLGTYTTSFKSSNGARAANVENGCQQMNGFTLYPGEELSAQEAMSPFTAENGYYEAGSYINGKVVDSLAGGICQVSTTLYNAVLLAELEVTERYNHSMTVTYVEPSADAAIASSAGKDFKFVNSTDTPIYIEGYTKNKEITFNIYGKETRDPGHAVRFESEILSTTVPSADEIFADPSQPIGYIVTEGAHTGYKAKLWKIVTENGVEVSRTQVNSSNYRMMPRSATVGVATEDAHAREEIMAAIGTANIDHVKNVIGALTAAPAPVYDDDDD